MKNDRENTNELERAAVEAHRRLAVVMEGLRYDGISAKSVDFIAGIGTIVSDVFHLLDRAVKTAEGRK